MPSIARPTPLSDAVHAALSQRILRGELLPGDALPSERLLAEEFEVNRHAIREALKRLQQAGLVRVSHGGATRVLDWRATGGLDLLAQIGRAADHLGPELIRSALEMRLCIGVDAARRCAERAPARVVDELQDLAAAEPESDGQAADAYERFWALIVEGADNLAYRLAINSLISDSSAFDLRRASLPEATDPEALRALSGAIARGNAPAAEIAARDLLERTEAPGGSPWST